MTSENTKRENKGGLKDQKTSLLYHNSYDIYNNVVSIVNEPPYNKLKSQCMHQATIRISLVITIYIIIKIKNNNYYNE